MKTLKQERNGSLKVLVGVSILGAIQEALQLARERKRIVTFTHHDLRVKVGPNSNLVPLLRDCIRALFGYIGKEVGPYPNVELTAAERANDARIAEESGDYQVRKSRVKAALESPRNEMHSVSL